MKEDETGEEEEEEGRAEEKKRDEAGAETEGGEEGGKGRTKLGTGQFRFTTGRERDFSFLPLLRCFFLVPRQRYVRKEIPMTRLSKNLALCRTRQDRHYRNK